LLGIPVFYQTFQFFVGRFGLANLELIAKYVPYTTGKKILDLGCGPASYTHLFSCQDYLGIDIAWEYIRYSRNKYPDYKFIKCNFLDLEEYSVGEANHKFDVILANGLLHHLDDKTASEYLLKAKSILNDGGYLIAIDGCIYQMQSRLRRFIVLSDRGKFVRTPEEYLSLAYKSGFTKCNSKLEERILAIPYSLFTMSLQA
jgi:SAM-dependent methyltransferase